MNKGKINWKVRFNNKLWLSSFVSQTLLLIQAVFFGLEGLNAIDLDLEKVDAWVKWLLGISDLILAYLTFLGIVADPTTKGVGDSAKALHREEPLDLEWKNN
jgi:phi LC3 family holin